jgi:acyl carrier protein
MGVAIEQPKKDIANLQLWIVNYLADILQLQIDEVDIDEQLVFLGVTSVQAIALTADLEKHLNRPLDPAILWECPTVRRLAGHLSFDSQGASNG